MPDCPGSCNDRYRKAHALYKDARKKHDALVSLLREGDPVPDPPEKPRIGAWEGEPVWCGTCTSRIRACLADLDDLAAKLTTQPSDVRPAVNFRREQVKVSGSHGERRSPSTNADTLTELKAWLLHYEREYRRLRHWPPPGPRGEQASVVTDALAQLGTHLDGVLRAPFSEPFGVELLGWHSELMARTHASKVEHFVPQACPKQLKGCGRYTLWQKPGEDITCKWPDCQRVFTQDELAEATAVHAKKTSRRG